MKRIVSFLGKSMRISLPFKCDSSTMEYGIEVFQNRDVEYINVRWETQYYSVLTITLLSAKNKRGSLVMKYVSNFKSAVRSRNESRILVMEEE